MPKKLKDREDAALTTPLSVSGTAEDLDYELPSTLVSFVSSHLQLRTLWRTREPRWTSDEGAQAEARSKSKTLMKKDQKKPETMKLQP